MLDRWGQIDLLVNNAGIAQQKLESGKDGIGILGDHHRHRIRVHPDAGNQVHFSHLGQVFLVLPPGCWYNCSDILQKGGPPMAGKDGLTLEKLRSFWRRGRRLWAKQQYVL